MFSQFYDFGQELIKKPIFSEKIRRESNKFKGVIFNPETDVHSFSLLDL